jgi:hypothetical protein
MNDNTKQNSSEHAEGQSRLNVGLGDAEILIANLYRARQKAKEEKKKWYERAAELECMDDTSVNGTCACYYVDRDSPEDWCENCKSKTEHRKVYHSASTAAGVSLNAIMRAGKKLASPNLNSTTPDVA